MKAVIFEPHDKVGWDPARDGEILDGLKRAYGPGPFQVAQVQTVGGNAECNCGSPANYLHEASCPKGLPQLVGHPQWLSLIGPDSQPIESSFEGMGPVTIPGRWFVKLE